MLLLSHKLTKIYGVTGMSIDKSLKKRGALLRARNVLKRHERIEKLREQDRWDEENQSPLGLPKVRIYRITARKTKKKSKDDK
jgi:small basic protein (TIGR04137 family)